MTLDIGVAALVDPEQEDRRAGRSTRGNLAAIGVQPRHLNDVESFRPRSERAEEDQSRTRGDKSRTRPACCSSSPPEVP